MTGRLPEISKWCKFEGNAWASPEGQGHSGWEELPYWLKGYGDLGYVLEDETIIAEARKWIDAVLASQEADGWFGPRVLKTSLEGKPDLWPHMVMLNVLQSFHEFSDDPRVIPFMPKYHQVAQRPARRHISATATGRRFASATTSKRLTGSTTAPGEAWLLDLAKKIHEHMANWTSA